MKKRAARTKTQFFGGALFANRAAELRYVKQLQVFAARNVRESIAEIVKKLRIGNRRGVFDTKSDFIDAIFKKLKDNLTKQATEYATSIVLKMIMGQFRMSKHAVNASLKDLQFVTSIQSTREKEGFRDIIEQAVTENTMLIKSIPEEMLDKMKKIITEAFAKGGGLRDIMPVIKEGLAKTGQSTERRAQLIALDQTRKVFAAVNRERFKQMGVTKFRWLHHAGSLYPRQMHIELSGKVFSFDDPPIIDRSGQRGFPAQLPNCRCTMAAVFDSIKS